MAQRSDLLQPRENQEQQDHSTTYIHNTCTSGCVSGPHVPDFKINVHVLWMCVLLCSLRPLGPLGGSVDCLCFLRETKNNKTTTTRKSITHALLLESGPHEPDFKILVHVLWMCVLLWSLRPLEALGVSSDFVFLLRETSNGWRISN